jgi:hypothetical protein
MLGIYAGVAADAGAARVTAKFLPKPSVWSPRTGRAVGRVSGDPKIPGVYKDCVTPLWYLGDRTE